MQVACVSSVYNHIVSIATGAPAKLIPAALDAPVKGIFLTLIFEFICLNLHIKDPSDADVDHFAR
jgi:hypothetical protein